MGFHFFTFFRWLPVGYLLNFNPYKHWLFVKKVVFSSKLLFKYVITRVAYFFCHFLQNKIIQYQKGIQLSFSFFWFFYLFVIFHKKVLIYLIRWTSVGLKLMSRKKPIIKAFYEVFLKFKLFIDNFSFCLSV